MTLRTLSQSPGFARERPSQQSHAVVATTTLNMKSSILAFTIAFAMLSQTAHSHEAGPAATAFSCPFTNSAPKHVDYAVMMTVYNELVRTFKDALGPLAKDIGDPKVAAKAAATRVDERKMAALAEVSGCAALIDQNGGCAQFFDPELGDPLSVFTSMKKTAPLRQQYEQAISKLARPDFKRAAQSCVKRVGSS